MILYFNVWVWHTQPATLVGIAWLHWLPLHVKFEIQLNCLLYIMKLPWSACLVIHHTYVRTYVPIPSESWTETTRKIILGRCVASFSGILTDKGKGRPPDFMFNKLTRCRACLTHNTQETRMKTIGTSSRRISQFSYSVALRLHS